MGVMALQTELVTRDKMEFDVDHIRARLTSLSHHLADYHSLPAQAHCPSTLIPPAVLPLCQPSFQRPVQLISQNPWHLLVSTPW